MATVCRRGLAYARVGSYLVLVTSAEPWQRRMTARVGQQLRHYREGRFTAQQLADRCEQLGQRIEVTVIANMETGRRTNITAAELAVLGAALDVPPALLVCPVGSLEDQEALPGRLVDSWTAYQWFTGTRPVTDVTGEQPGAPGPPGRGDRLTIYRQHEDSLRGYLFVTQRDADPEQAAGRRHLERLAGARISMHRNGWRLPELPAAVIEALHLPLAGWGYEQDGRGGLTELPHAITDGDMP